MVYGECAHGDVVSWSGGSVVYADAPTWPNWSVPDGGGSGGDGGDGDTGGDGGSTSPDAPVSLAEVLLAAGAGIGLAILLGQTAESEK